MRNEKITYEEQYHGHPIMTDKARQLGCKESILQKADQIMTDMSVEVTTSSDDPSYFFLLWNVATILQHFLFCKW